MLYEKMKTPCRYLIAVLGLLCAAVLHAQQPAFPGAEGAGMFTNGGRGTPTVPTTVFEVTNLLDNTQPGSLRYALTTAAAYRTIVFRVSGTIHLNASLGIPANTTIAGQTAPGDGICVADYPVSIKGDHVIVRYMRFRMGDKNQKKLDANGNPIDGSGGDDAFGGTGPSNIIIDHVTASWSDDEALTIYRGDNLTIQWCLISEPLNYSYHFETGDTDYEHHGYGGIWGAKRGSMHHNLFAHCRNRNPRFAGISTYTPNTIGVENVDFRNNVLYNWGINTVYGGEGGNYNVVNNYYKYGPNTGSGVRYRICNPSNSATVPFGKWYVDGNYVDGSPGNTSNNWAGVAVTDPSLAMATTPFNLGYAVNTEAAVDAFESVLQRTGCSLPNRDTLDQRIINNVRNRTGSIIDVQGGYPHGTPYDQTVNAWPALATTTAPADSDHDGMPDNYETTNGLNPNDAADRNGYAANGYTNLENYLNSLTNPVTNTNPVIYGNASFTGFGQTTGSPSAMQTFPVSGANLTGVITITAPANYQLSTDGVNWSTVVTLNPNAGTVPSTTIRVRLNAAANGSYDGNIILASNGAPTLNFAVTGITSSQVLNQKQIIGIFPAMEGGFENQSAGAVATTAPVAGANLLQTVWTTSGSANIVNNGTARTGNNFFSYTSTSGSTKNVYSPTVSAPVFSNNTKYIVQYYYRAATPVTGNTVSGLLAVADSTNFSTAYATIAYAGTNNGWSKAALPYSINPAYTPLMSYGGLRFNGGGAAIVKPFDVDDLVVYAADDQANPAPDVTAPNVATTPVATGHSNGTIDVNWTAPATGTDGGGYLVVRSTSATAPVLNANGIYSLGNNISAGNTVVYIGITTGFTDNGSVAPISSGTTYYYYIFTVDKAFNFSTAAVASASVTVTPVLPVMVYTADNADAVVALDGSGDYTSVQAAIDAAPTGRTTPWVIFIKNGRYFEKVKILSNKSFIHLIGESAANTVISWDSYSGKIENGVPIGTNTSATLTVNANDFFMMSITVENTTGYTGDGPQALAIYMNGDRCVYKNCRFIGGQDTVWHNGNGRHYFKNCYIDGNTDFIFGSSTAVFDSCAIHPRDRVDGGGGGYITAGNTPSDKTYGEVFRDCILTKNRGVTVYTLGRPWQNAPKTVYLNTYMGSSINPIGWSTWNVDTAVIVYAEYKSKKYNGDLVDVSKRVSWSKQLSDAEAAPYYNNGNLFGTWDPFMAFPALNAPVATELAVANFRAQRGAANTLLSWNLCWPTSGVTFELFRSTDSIHYTSIKQVMGGVDSIVAFSITDSLPAKGTIYYYYVKASKSGYTANDSYVAVIDPRIPLDGDYRSAGSGYWSNTSSGNGANAVSIWERYVASSKSWVLQSLGSGPSNANVTIRSGDTVMIDGLKSANNLVIEQGAVLKSNGGYGATPGSQTLRLGVGSATSIIIQNDGVFGGTANPDDLITLEFTGSCASVLWTGAGFSQITRLRPLPANPNALKVVFDQDVNLSYNSGAFTAYYNNTGNKNNEDVTFTINKGKTIKLVNPSGSFSHAGAATSNPGGNYTYNIEGTLDLSATTTTSNVVPYSNNALSVVAVNVRSGGLLKLGKGFNTVNSAPSADNNGKVLLTIADSGLVDATQTTNLNLGNIFFISTGTGTLKRKVDSTATVFPIGTSATSYNPVTLTNTGTADQFTVSLKNSFDHAVPDSNTVVNKQWTIREEVAGGSNVTAKFGWNTADQASGFDPAQLLAVMRYDGNWKIATANAGGTGTLTDPYTATASGFTGFSNFVVTNYTPPAITACPSVPVQEYNPAGTYTIPLLTVTDLFGLAHISYTMSGATVRNGNGDASGQFNVGASTINWLVDDGIGNQATCTTQVVVNPPVCGRDGNKVLICHKGIEICISPDDAQIHLNHGDQWGPCAGPVSGSQVLIYPNPVYDNLKVYVSNLEPGATIKLFTIFGRLVRSITMTSQVQDVSMQGLQKGVYFVVVRNGAKIIIEKILKL